MATQSIEFRSPTGQSVIAKLFAVGSDGELASAAATEATNRKGTYRAEFTNLPAGEYQLIALVGSVPLASGYVTLTLETATFQLYGRARTVITDDKSGMTLAPDQAVNVTKVGGTAVTGPEDLKANVEGLALAEQLPENMADLAIDELGRVAASNVQVTVQPTVLSEASIEAINAPVLAAIGDLEGGGPEALMLTIQTSSGGEPISGVSLRIASRTLHTDTAGRASLPLNPGTYALRIIPPSGFADEADREIVIGDSEVTEPIELTSLIAVIIPPPGTCALTVQVADQSGVPLEGVPVSGKLPKGYLVNVDTLNLNTLTHQITNSQGLATLILIRDQPYDLTAQRPDRCVVTLRIQVPDAEQATLSQVIQV